MKRMKGNSRFRGMMGILAIFLVVALLLFAERTGVQIGNLAKHNPYLEAEQVITSAQALSQQEKSALMITNLAREDCQEAYSQMQQILLDMKVNSDTVDLAKESCPSSFDAYSTVVVVTPDLDSLGDNVLKLSDWVYQGGRVMLTMTLEHGTYSDFFLQKSGALFSGEYTEVNGIYFDKDFMIGGGQSYEVQDGFDSALAVQLREDVEIFARIGDEKGSPLVWRNWYGDGCIVVANYGFYERSVRGLYSTAYTLLDDVSVYPVLNGAVMFLDDMPSPVPQGNSEYISRDYHTSIAAYYINHWFPDIQHLSEKFQFPLTGLIIENYEDTTDGTTKEQSDTTRFSYFGNLILRSGGELGYHGFNHQPLCLPNTDYKGEYDYKTWDSVEAMDSGFQELMRFSKMLYPETSLTTYVPPSNILSKEGREYLGSLFPEVRTISGVYLDEDGNDLPFVQEFGVSEDGIVDVPRITSGSILDPSIRMAAISELNFHMAFSHFVHPDDALDPDRGAEMGWEKLYSNMEGFMQWLVDADPSIRRMNAADFAGTVQRWAMLTVDKQWQDENTLSIHLGNYVDEAYLQLRFNHGAPAQVSGGTLTQLTGNLYLLEAQQADITLEWS